MLSRLSYLWGTRIVVAALGAALVASWVSFAVYQWAWLPIQRHKALLYTGGFVYERGPVVLVGDSILAALPECEGTLNLAVVGARAAQLDANYAASIAVQSPSRIVILIGINDLLAGRTPSAVATSIGGFAQALRRHLKQTRITVLSVLPIAENDPALNVANSVVDETNMAVRSLLSDGSASFVDIAGLLGGHSLNPGLTYDGLHLNALGSAILFDVLFHGLARSNRPERCKVA